MNEDIILLMRFVGIILLVICLVLLVDYNLKKKICGKEIFILENNSYIYIEYVPAVVYGEFKCIPKVRNFTTSQLPNTQSSRQ